MNKTNWKKYDKLKTEKEKKEFFFKMMEEGELDACFEIKVEGGKFNSRLSGDHVTIATILCEAMISDKGVRKLLIHAVDEYREKYNK